MGIPKVFISYSHDSFEHKRWTLDLATRLRSSGIDAILDQWELKAGDDIPHFMETHLASSDYTLMICTESYVQKANEGIGGVGYEKMIVTSDLMRNIDSNKVIPIIRQDGTKVVPTFLKSKLFIDLSYTQSSEFNFDELLRTIHGSPLFEKPAIGNNPFASIETMRPEKANDNVRELMKAIVFQYESTGKIVEIDELLQIMSISRIKLELILIEAEEMGLVDCFNNNSYIKLNGKGKFYAVEHELI
jgi:hypothetical protein